MTTESVELANVSSMDLTLYKSLISVETSKLNALEEELSRLIEIEKSRLAVGSRFWRSSEEVTAGYGIRQRRLFVEHRIRESQELIEKWFKSLNDCKLRMKAVKPSMPEKKKSSSWLFCSRD